MDFLLVSAIPAMGVTGSGGSIVMYDQDKDAADERGRWFGVQEAANYLGIHRATLFRALRSGLITADRTTPKGRARFRLTTLDEFQSSLRHQAATSQDRVYTPVRVLAKLAGLARTAASPEEGAEALQDAMRLLCFPGGGFDMACSALHVPSDTDPYALNFMAEVGLPERLKAAYQHLRPYVDFPMTVVLRTGVPEICEDIQSHPSPHATAMRVLKQDDVLSYAVYPIATGDGAAKKILGVLAVSRRTSHKFSQQEQVFLGGVADALSACMTCGVLNTRFDENHDTTLLTPEKTLGIVSLLLESAFSQTRCQDVLPSPVLPAELLCNVLVERSQALTTWVYGFPPQDCGNTPAGAQEDDLLHQYRSNLQSLVQRASAADGLKREQWQSRVTAVALPVPLPTGQRGAVGAVWPGVRMDVAAEGILLSTLASACSLVSEYS
jgi:excisionase family DNA binding protein